MPNIGPGQQRRRLIIGAAGLVLALGVAAVSIVARAPAAAALVLAAPVWLTAVTLLQVRSRTCVLLARRGVRNLDRGVAPIVNPRELAATRAQAATIFRRATLIAIVATAALAVLLGQL